MYLFYLNNKKKHLVVWFDLCSWCLGFFRVSIWWFFVLKSLSSFEWKTFGRKRCQNFILRFKGNVLGTKFFEENIIFLSFLDYERFFPDFEQRVYDRFVKTALYVSRGIFWVLKNVNMFTPDWQKNDAAGVS